MHRARRACSKVYWPTTMRDMKAIEAILAGKDVSPQRAIKENCGLLNFNNVEFEE
ncbi:hypothetical protein D3C78_303280 [compost metagenome]